MPSEDMGERELLERLGRLQARCQQATLETRIDERTMPVETSDGSFREETHAILVVQVPARRETREVRFGRFHDLDFVEKSSFENWRFVEGYQAIWSPAVRAIECQLAGIGPGRLLSRVMASLREQEGMPVEAMEPPVEEPQVEFPSPEGLRILLGPGSPEHGILCNPPRRFIRVPNTIRIEGIRTDRHDEARDILERVGNSVLFQLDLAFHAGVYLAEERRQGIRRPFRRRDAAAPTLAQPAYEYDQEPIALYWYARTATGMPLLEYLAYYQVLEFYFPIYAEREAQQVIRDRLKDPRFSPTRDTDINRLIAAIRRTGTATRSFGDERSQLRATIAACVTAEELREFLEADPGMKEFFSTKSGDIVVPKKRISLSNPKADVTTEVADRIYEIRCRVVHTKSGFDSDVPLMLPFSREARNLQYDLDLIRFIVREALVAASRPLRL